MKWHHFGSVGLFYLSFIILSLGCQRQLKEAKISSAFSVPVLLDSENAEYLYIKKDAGASQGIVMVVRTNGSVGPLIKKRGAASTSTSGTPEELPEMEYAEVGPDGRTYVLFASPITINGKNCIFVRSKNSSTTECVDHDVVNLVKAGKMKVFQFSDSQVIYYGKAADKSQALLAKPIESLDIANEKAKVLTNIKVQLEAYVISGDRFLIYGTSLNSLSTTYFLREIDLKTGELSTILNLSSRLKYIEVWNRSLHFYLSKKEVADYGFYFIDSEGTLKKDNSVPTEVGDILQGGGIRPDGVEEDIFAIDPQSPGTLIRLKPTYQEFTTSVASFTSVTSIPGSLIFAALDSTDHFVTKVRNNDTGLEETLFNDEIEIYDFTITTTHLHFSGLRFSDNKYIVGRKSIGSLTDGTYEVVDTSMGGLSTF